MFSIKLYNVAAYIRVTDYGHGVRSELLEKVYTALLNRVVELSKLDKLKFSD